MGLELLYLANKDTGHPVKCEFSSRTLLSSQYFVGLIYIKNVLIFLPKFNMASENLR